MGDTMLKRIRITGYRSIRDASIDLDNINILIGPNGGGKSNFLSALELIQRLYLRIFRLQSRDMV